MKTIVAILFLSFAITACNSQEKEKQETKEEVETDIIPKEKWEVKKEFDEFGNLIKYDSLYVWKYSNVQGDSIEINLDSIMDNFRSHFKDTTPFKWDEFSYFPKDDSLLNDDFFRKDYYLRNWERQETELFEFIKQFRFFPKCLFKEILSRIDGIKRKELMGRKEGENFSKRD